MSAADKQLAAQIAAQITQKKGLSSVWFNTLDELDGIPDLVMRGWLSAPGLLTQRLRSNCGERFNMRLLNHQSDPVAAGLRREVLLCCGDNACIYAVTDIPAATLTVHGWLAELGDEPLGEALRSRNNVSRSAFEYALIDTACLPADITQDPSVWARRSEFRIGSDALSVTEVFLPGLAHCTARETGLNSSGNPNS
jgi:chorismate--pyruvate lyase